MVAGVFVVVVVRRIGDEVVNIDLVRGRIMANMMFSVGLVVSGAVLGISCALESYTKLIWAYLIA